VIGSRSKAGDAAETPNSSSSKPSSTAAVAPEDDFKATNALVTPPLPHSFEKRADEASTEQLLEDAIFRLRASVTMGARIESMPAAVLVPGMPVADVGDEEIDWLCE